MPDHQKVGNRQCPFGQVNCNCWNPASKIPCQNKVCGAIYDQIIQFHGSTPPAPYWRNTDIQKWSTDHWSIAKCFINAPGYDQKSSAAETDCNGLLHLIINNKEIHNHIQCNITGTDVFSKVKGYRNILFHSHTMELDDVDMKSYIADMIAVLQDGKELNSRPDTQTAVVNLQELDKADFIITTKCEAEIFNAAFDAVKNRQTELDVKIEEIVEKLPTKEDVGQLEQKVTAMEGHLEQRVTALESVTSKQEQQINKHDEILQKHDQEILKFKEELEKLNSVQRLHEKQRAFVQYKLGFQSDLINFYKEKLLKVSIFPLNPRCNLTELNSVYTKPEMVTERKKPVANPGAKRTEEIEISSMKELFMKDGRPIKSVYVVGEAGSGKSSFCRSLVNSWCQAHSEQQTNEDEFGGIEEMRKFGFLFHIPLSHASDNTRVQDMLLKTYERPVLEEILDNESETCLIILDGLDEWNPQTFEPSPFQTVGLPIQEQFKNYTVITTSRPWKLETLQITEIEIQLKVKLKDFGKNATKNLIEKSVPILNDIFSGNRLADDCKKHIANISVSDINRTPVMLQQLICLWYDGKLNGTSRCAIYSAMLELFFEWNSGKFQDGPSSVKRRKRSRKNVTLPEYLHNIEACKTNLYLIEGMSRLAYETLFNNQKEMSISFDSSSFERFKIPDYTKECCVKLGILSEDKEEILAASQSSCSIYSFVHKSQQEFLAAVYIGIHAQAMLKNADIRSSSIHFVDEYLKCVTVEDILDKENVLIMLSGLEPRLATYISKYVSNIVTNDKRVLKYRTSAYFHYSEKQEYVLLSNIENCVFSCIDEVLSRNTNCESRFHLGDVLINTEENCDRFLLYSDKKSIRLESVLSFDLEIEFLFRPINAKKIYSILRYLSDCRQLAKVNISISYSSDEYLINNDTVQCVCNIFRDNVSTLQSVSIGLRKSLEQIKIYKSLIRLLPSMTRLVALKIDGYDPSVSHEDCCILCSFLSSAEHMEQIFIDLVCDCGKQHALDLSKHKNLRTLKLRRTFVLESFNSSHLEHFIHADADGKNIEQMLDILFTASNLKELQLGIGSGDYYEETITKKLTRLLSSLRQLRDLSLFNFYLADNIITCPSEIKYLNCIYMHNVKLSMTTWQKFIDSLTDIPHSVHLFAINTCLAQYEDDNPCLCMKEKLIESVEKAGAHESDIDYIEPCSDGKEDFEIWNMIFRTKK